MPREESFALVVRVEVNPDRIEEALDMFTRNMEKSVREEEGCLTFDVLRGDTPNKLIFYEVYKDEAAFQFHLTTPMFKEWLEFKNSGGILSLVPEKAKRIIRG
jgi:autoinducer 2-degrading protein